MKNPSKPTTLLKIGEASKILGVSIDTLRRWEKAGKIKAIRTPGGTRLYSLESLKKVNPASVETYHSSSLSTEELLKRTDDSVILSSSSVILNASEGSLDSRSLDRKLRLFQNESGDSSANRLRMTMINKFLLGSAFCLILTLLITSWITASYLTNPKDAGQFFKNNVASGILSPFHFLAGETVAIIDPKKADELGFSRPEPPPLVRAIHESPLQSNTFSNVLAVTSTTPFLEVNANTQINGSLFVRDSINGLSLEATSSANTMAFTSGNTQLTVTKSAKLDQDVSTEAAPTFTTLNLSATKDQLVFQSGGPTGTLTWTPTTARIITLPDVTTTLVGIDNTQTLTNKSMSGSSNTFTNIPNSALTNNKITVTAGTNLTGGGDINLGSSATIGLKDSVSLSGTLTVSGASVLSSTLAVTGATTLSSTLAVSGTTTLSGAATLSSTLAVTGATTLSSSLTVAGNVGIGFTGATASAPGLGLAVQGSMGIGTTSPNNKLQVIGAGVFGGDYGAFSAPANGLLVQGNVGIGSTGDVNYNLDVWGTARITGALTVGGNITPNGQYLAINGSAAAPGYAFVNSTSTGLWSPSANALSLTTNGSGTSGLTITANGNVGIGVTNPVGALQVSGAAAIGYGSIPASSLPTNGLAVSGNVGIGTTSPANHLHILSPDAAASIKLESTDTNGYPYIWLTNAGDPGWAFIINGADAGAIDNSLAIRHGTTPAITLQTGGSVGLGGANSTTSPALWAGSNGNVGIGFTSPNALLHIGGANQTTAAYGIQMGGDITLYRSATNTLKTDNNLVVGGTITSSGTQFLASNGSASAPSYSFTNLTNSGLWTNGDGLLLTTGGSNTSGITITAAGLVGIGNTSPAAAFQVNSGASSTVITSSGNIGIGSSSPVAKLQVIGTSQFNGASTYYGNLLMGADNTYDIGSAATRVGNVYAYNVTADNIAGVITGGSTTSSDWLINSGNTSDSANSSLSFKRGSPTNAVLQWYGNNNTFDFNSGIRIGINNGAASTIESTTGLVLSGFGNDITTGANENLSIIPNGTGNVGIGTSSPLSLLSVAGNAHIGSLQQGISAPTDGLFVDGNVGIGATTSSNKLDVWGNSRLAGTLAVDGAATLSSTLGVTGALTLSANNAALSFTGSTPSLTSGTSVFGLFAGGNVGIGTTGNLYGGLTVRGAGTGTNIALQTYGSGLGQGLTVLDNGNVGIGTTNPAQKFDVNNFFVVDTANSRVGIGTSVPQTALGITQEGARNGLEVSGPGNNAADITTVSNAWTYNRLFSFGSDSSNVLDFMKAEGTRNAPTAMSTETTMGYIIGQGYNNGGWQQSVSINLQRDGALGATNVPGLISFNTASATVAKTERMRIDSSGYVSLAADTDTYWSHPAADTLAWTTGGLERLRLDSSGNIGIGTTGPGSLFAVSGNTTIGFGATTSIAGPSNGLGILGNVGIGTTTANYNLSVVGTTNITGNLSFGSQLLAANGSASLPSYSFSNLTNAGLWTNGDGLLLTTGGSNTSGLTVTGAGNIGIGITNPTGVFQVGSSAATPVLFASSLTGNIGIGTTGPSGILDVGPGSKDIKFFSNVASGQNPSVYVYGDFVDTHEPYYGRMFVDTGARFIIDTQYEGALRKSSDILRWSSAGISILKNGGTGAFFAYEGGNVGIGTISPGSALTVIGNIGIGTSAAGAALQVNGGGLFGWGTALVAGPANGLAVSGNVGVGTTSPAGALHVVGQCVTGDTRLRRRRRRRRQGSGGRGKDGEWEDYFEDVEIKDVKEGDEILTLDQDTGKFISNKVKALKNMGKQEVFELITESGKSIQTTKEHPYLVDLTDQKSNLNMIQKNTFEYSETLAKQFYIKSLAGRRIKSKALNDTVLFTHTGWNHFVEKSRSLNELIIRFFALPRLPLVLKHSQRVTGYRKTIKEDIIVEYWELQAIVEHVQVRVLVSAINGGQKFFLSCNWLGTKEEAGILASKKELSLAPREINSHSDRRRELVIPQLFSKLTLPENRENVKWVKVQNLIVGQKIATTNGWEKIVSIKSKGRKQTFDIEVEGTHNFVGNDIVAHNTIIMNGNLGLGTASPASKFHLVGSGTTTGVQLMTQNSTQTNFGLSVLDNGNVGIGTTGPGSSLQVSGNSVIGFGGATSIAGPANGLGISGNLGVGTTTANNKLQVIGAGVFGADYGQYTAAANGLLIQGNVGIGATTSSNKLDVWGNARVTGTLTVDGTLSTGSLSAPNFLAGNGSASAPAYSFTNLTNAGLWTNGDGLLLTTGGSNTSGITVTGAGNVGIGTTAPNALFAVGATSQFQVNSSGVLFIGTIDTNVSSNSDNRLIMGNENARVRMQMSVASGDAAHGPTFNFNRYQGSFASPTVLSVGDELGRLLFSGYTDGLKPSAAISAESDTGWSSSGNDAPGRLLFFTTPDGSATLAERMRITTTGNVGIGFTSPAALLHIGGANQTTAAYGIQMGSDITLYRSANNTLKTDNNLVVGGTITSSGTQFLASNGSASLPSYSFTNLTNAGLWTNGDGLLLTTGGSNTSGITVTGAGNVGIGTTNPSVKLEVAGIGRFTDTYGFSIGGDTGQYRIQAGSSEGNAFGFYSSGNGYAPINALSASFGSYAGTAAPSNGMIISGNVGIGFTSPNALFTVGASNQFQVNSSGAIAAVTGITTSGGYTQTGSSANTFSGANTFSANNAALSFTGSTPSLTSGSSVFGLFAGGNVGIGTTGNLYGGLTVRGAGTGTNITLQTYGAGLGQGLTVLDNGNVGIGTTGPGALFEAAKTSDGAITEVARLSNNGNGTGTGAALTFYDQNIQDGIIKTLYTDAWTLNLGTDTTYPNTMTLKNGNVGIGTTNPSYTLDINGPSLRLYQAGGNPSAYVTADADKQATIYLGSTATALYRAPSTTNLTIYAGSADVATFTGTAIQALKTVEAGSNIKMTNGTSNTIFFGTTGAAAPGDASAGEKIQLYGTSGTISSTDYALGIESSNMWFNTAGGYKWYVNSVAKNVMDSNGNVGIGTTSPLSLLSVAGNTHIGGLFQGISAPANGLFVDGNVGIGATTSSNKLDVWGNSRLAGTLTVDSTSTFGGNLTLSGNLLPSADDTYDLGSNTARWQDIYLGPGSIHLGTSTSDEYVMTYDTTNNRLGFNVNGSGLAEIVMDSSGNVGIGTTAPTNGKLEIYSNEFALNSSTGGAISIYDTPGGKTAGRIGVDNVVGALTLFGNTGIILTATGNDSIRFYQGTTERMRIDSDTGNVGIGTVSPGSALTVIGNIGIGTSAAGAALQVNGGGLFGWGTALVAGPANGLAISGNVGVGTTSPAGALHVVGQCVTGDTLLKRRRRKKKNTSGVGSDSPDVDDWEWEDVRIDEIKPGDEILSMAPDGTFEWRKVNALKEMGLQSTYKLITNKGKQIRTTGNHPYFILEKRPVEELKKLYAAFEVDQSNRLEDMSKDSVVSLVSREPDYDVSVAIKISKKTKLAIRRRFYGNRPKYFGPEMLAIAVIYATWTTGLKVGKIVIDKEYNNYEKYLSKFFYRYYPEMSIRFQSIGHSSAAHQVAWGALKRQKALRKSALAKSGANLDFNESLAAELLHSGMPTGDSQPTRLLLSGVYQTPLSLSMSMSEAKWIPAHAIRKGMLVATVDGWEVITSIYETKVREQTFDIEVEGTHNFVGNDIVAHNTAIFSGNVGIGVTSPTTFNLQVAGNIGPNANDTYDLGSDAMRWANVYVGPSTLHLGTSTSDEYAIAYDTTNNRLGFNVNGSGPAEIVMDSSGNLGIGTTGPSRKLDIFYADTSTSLTEASFIGARVENDSTTDNSFSSLLLRSNTFDSGFAAINNGTTNSGRLSIFVDDTATQDLKEAVSILATSGNVGIGTSSPLSLLSVAGGAHIGALYQGTSAPTNGLFVDGNVGIGATTSSNKLDVWGNARVTGTLTVDSTLTNSSVFRAANGSASTPSYSFTNLTNAGLWTNGDGLLLTTGGSNTSGITVTGAGNVGIGTTSPSKIFQVSSDTNSTLIGPNLSSLFRAGAITVTANGGFVNPIRAYDGNLGSFIEFQKARGSLTNPTTVSLNDELGSIDFWGFDGSTVQKGAVIKGLVDSAPSAGSVPGRLSFYTGSMDANNTERVRIDSSGHFYSGNIGTSIANANLFVSGAASGNVGIGTTNPGAKFTVSGGNPFDNQQSNFIVSSNSTKIGIDYGTIALQNTNSSAGNFNTIAFVDSNNFFSAMITGIYNDHTTHTGELNFTTRNTSGFVDAMRINTNGNVGIGTTGPLRKLHVSAGDILVDENYSLRGGINGNNGYTMVTVNGADMLLGDTNASWNNITFAPGSAEKMRIQSGGNVGIGAASPGAMLHVTGNAMIGYANNTTPASLANGLAVSGNVGIGTTVPGAKLHISPTLGAGVADLQLGDYAVENAIVNLPNSVTFNIDSTNQYEDDRSFVIAKNRNSWTGGTALVTVKESGNVGIGTASPVGKLHLIGAGITTGVQFLTQNSTQTNFGLAVLDNGNVGIGTTGPQTSLHVTKTNPFSGLTSNTAALTDATLTLESTTAQAANVGPVLGFGGLYNASDKTLFSAIRGAKENATSGQNGGYLGFYTTQNGVEMAERMRIDSTGNVGIGFTSPAATLDVVGTSLLRGTNGVYGLTVTNAGSVGIGLTNPTTKLDILGSLSAGAGNNTIAATSVKSFAFGDGNTVTGGANPAFAFGQSNTVTGAVSFASGQGNNVSSNYATALGYYNTVSGDYASLALGRWLTASGDDSTVIGSGVDNSNHLVNSVANSFAVGYNSTIPTFFVGPSSGAGTVGNVGIGTTNPGSNLAVSGNAVFGFGGATSIAGPSNGLGISGNLGIGTTTANNKLQVIGAGVFGSDWGQYSAPANGLLVQGNIGIGATTSNNKLDVWGNANITGTLTTGAQTINGNLLPGADNLYALGSTSMRWSSLHVGPGSVVVHNDATNTNWSKLDFSGSMAQLITDAATPLQLVVGTNNLGVYLNANGNVGIGTTDATKRLTVFDADGAQSLQLLSDQGDAYYFRISNQGNMTLSRDSGSGVNMVLQTIGSYAAGAGNILLQPAGNVGIGNTAPGSYLQVNGNAVFGFGGATSIAGPSNGLAVSGNVGIGTTTANYNLSVVGTSNVTGAATFGSTLGVTGALTLSANNAALTFTGSTPSITSGSSVFGLFAGGNVGIGTTGNLYGGLTVRGAGTGTNIALQTYGSGLGQGLTVLDNGNVGIGTTAPSALFSVGATSQFQVSSAGTVKLSNGNYIDIQGTDGNGLFLNTNAYNNAMISVGGGADRRNLIFGEISYFNSDYDHASQTNPTLFIHSATDPDTDNTQWLSLTHDQTNAVLQTGKGALTFKTPTAEALRIDATGNVGIGNSNPQGLFEVGNAATPALYIASPTGNVGIGTTGPTAPLHVYTNGSHANLTIQGGGTYDDARLFLAGGAGAQAYFNRNRTTQPYLLNLQTDGSSKWSIGNNGESNENLYFYDAANSNTKVLTIESGADANSLYINSSGNVGIGTTGPTAGLAIGTGTPNRTPASNGLYVTGQSEFDASTYFDSTIWSESQLRIQAGNIYLISDIPINFGTQNQYDLRYNSTSSKLELGDGTSNFLTLNDQGTTADFNFNNNAFWVGNNGNVGIGTTNPLTSLYVTGNAMIGYTSGAPASLANGLAVSGNVGIGTTAPGAMLDINNGGGATNGINFANLGTATRGIDFSNSGLSGATDYLIFHSLSNYWAAAGNMRLASTLRIEEINAGDKQIELYDHQGNNLVDFIAASGNLTMSGIRGNYGFIFDPDGTGDTSVTTASGSDFIVGTNQLYVQGSDGNIGIGATVPQAKLVIQGNVGIGYTGANQAIPVNGLAVFGNVGIGTTTANYNLSVVGTANITGALSVGSLTNTGTFLAANGTASLPAYSFTNLTNAGLWTNGDGLLLTTGGSNTSGLTVTANGNVGIGTTASGAKLELKITGGGGITSDFISILNDGGSADQVSRIIWKNGVDPVNTAAIASAPGAGYNAGDLRFQTATNGTLSTKMTITNTGYVGINHASPGNYLSIAGGLAIGAIGDNTYPTTTAPSGGAIIQGNVGIGTVSPVGLLQVGNSPTPGLVVLSGGNVGIGTTGPAARFQINENTSAPFAVQSNGNVGIGTSAPSNILDIYWNTAAETALSFTKGARAYTLGIDGNNIFQIADKSTNKNRLSVNGTTGDVNIGTAGNDSANLYLSGNMGIGYASGTVGARLAVAGNAMIGYSSGAPLSTLANGLAVSGNVGIGTTDPTRKFTIKSGTATTLAANTYDNLLIEADDAPTLRFRDTGVGEAAITGDNGGFRFVSSNDATYGNIVFATGMTSNAEAYGAGTARMTILNGGNIGIGTASPVGKLHLIGAGTTTAPTLMTQNSTSTNFGLAVLDNGNVGIGTTNPIYPLEVVNDQNGSTVFHLDNNTSGTAAISDVMASADAADIHLYAISSGYTTSNQFIADSGLLHTASTASGGLGISAGGAYPITFWNNNVENMRITSTGNVGIGTTAPGFPLDVNGKIGIGGTQIAYLPNQTNFTGSLIIGDGGGSLSHSSGSQGFYNTALGIGALSANTTGNSNTALGWNALNANTTGIRNTAIGYGALDAATAGDSNVAIGWNAMGTATATAGYNVAIGYYALDAVTTGLSNVALGDDALRVTTTGNWNFAASSGALAANKTGISNIAIGRNSMTTNTTGGYNIALGENSLLALKPTSKAITAYADYSGTVAGTVKATSASHGRTTGDSVVISGTTNYDATETITVIDADNFYFTATWVADDGASWWQLAGEGLRNVAIGGLSTAYQLTTGSNNVFLGSNAGYSEITGSSNVFLGYMAGYTETGSNKLYISNSNVQNLIYGDFATGNLSLGGTSAPTAPVLYVGGGGNVGIGTTIPVAKLQLNGTGTTTAPTFMTQNSTSTNFGLAVLDNGNVGIGTTNPLTSLYVTGNAMIGYSSGAPASLANGLAVSGNVGIGTTSPAHILEISGGGQTSVQNGVDGIYVNPNSAHAMVTFENSAGVEGGMMATGGIVYAGSWSNHPLYFRTNNDEKMVITAAGNVGIGTLAPKGLLQVGTSPNPGLIVLSDGNVGIGTTGPIAKFQVNATGTSSFVVDSSGNVGIGTSTTGVPLTVRNLGTTAGTALVVDNEGQVYKTSSSARYKDNIQDLNVDFNKILEANPKSFTYKDTGAKDIGFIAEDFNSLGLKDLVIYDNQGRPDGIKYDRVGLYLLEVVKNQQSVIGNLSMSEGGKLSSGVGFDSPEVSTGQLFVSGNVGIGTTDPGAYKLYVNGPGYLNDTGWTYASDSRLKENIESVSSGLDIINALNPITFDYISGGQNRSGFIAQEVQQVLPDLVSQRPDGMLSLRTDEILPYAVKAIQEQQSVIARDSKAISKLNALLTGVTLDKDGSLIVPAIKAGTITLDPSLTVTLNVSEGSLANASSSNELRDSSLNAQNDIGTKIASLEDRLAALEAQLGGSTSNQTGTTSSSEVEPLNTATDSTAIATASATPVIASTSASLSVNSAAISSSSAEIASSSSTLPQDGTIARNDDIMLKLTPPDLLLATASAQLYGRFMNRPYESDATVSGQLTAYNLNVQEGFKSLGKTTLGDTLIAGTLTIDGTLSIENGNEINVMGTLYLQKSALATNIDLFAGKVTIDNNGNITTSGTVLATQFAVKANTTTGTGTIPIGTIDAIIENEYVDENSVILITPHTPLSQTMAVADKIKGGFLIKLARTETKDITFDYLIVGVKP